MNIYSLKTSLGLPTKEYVCSVFGTNSEICKYATDNFPEITEVANFPESDENQPLSQDELYSIIDSRVKRLKSARNSSLLSVGDPDYLFSEFLGRGLRCSNAVCLLLRGFQLDELIEKIKDRPTKDIPEILRWLSWKLERYSELNPKKEPGGRQDRWIDVNNTDKKVSEALEDTAIKEALAELQKQIHEKPNEEERRREATVYVPFATGFLVGKNYLMTNFHVLNDKNQEEINNFLACFRYERDVLGENVQYIEYELDSEICISDEFLDFSIVGVKPKESYEKDGLSFPEAGDNFGWFPMFADPTLIAPPIKQEQFKQEQLSESEQELRRQIPRVGLTGEPAFIIQHPGGGRKRIVLFNNSVQEIYQKFLRYETDTSFGASGACILNGRWQLVGLHHSAIAKLAVDQEPEILGNLGTRMCAIVDFLEKNKENKVAQALLANDRYVVKMGDVPVKGKIYLLCGYQRPVGEVPSLEQANQEVELAKLLLEKVQGSSEYSLPMENVFEEEGSYENGLKALIQREDYQSGDIAVEIRINFYPEASEQSTKIKVYYAEDNLKFKTYADVLLSQIRSKAGGNITTGNIQPVVKENSDSNLQFCTAINNVPAFIIRFDFYGMDFDQIKRRIDPGPVQQSFILENVVVNSLKAVVKIISPIGFFSGE